MSAARRHRATIVAAGSLAVLLSACVAASDPSASTAPAPVGAKPVPSIPGESQVPHDCQTWNLQGTPVTPSIESLARVAPVVVIATLDGYGKPFWDTPDGKAATQEVVQHGDAEILTPVILDVSGAVKGKTEVADHAVVFGGTIGCDVFTSAETPAMAAEGRYVVFLLPRTKGGAATGDAWLVAAWQIGPDDNVNAPADGPRNLGQLIREIQAGKPESTLEPGAEPTSGYP
jgi:hypothetical protein